MRLTTFKATEGSSPALGALIGEEIVDLQAAELARNGGGSGHLTGMLAWLEGGAKALDVAGEALEFALEQRPPGAVHLTNDVQLLAPMPRPESVRDCMAFEKHLVQATRTVIRWKFPPLAALDGWVERARGKALVGCPAVWYELPLYYKANRFAVVGDGADIRWPSVTEKLDYELEFGIFIGKGGRDIPKESAAEHIAGYAIFNDFSARDIQMKEMGGRLGPAKGKDFDTANAIGPCLVTPDEIPDPYALTATARINGEQWSRGNTSDMHWSFEELIAWISKDETLYPGEFIGSGTVPGGCGLEQDRYLSPGDVVELEFEHLGVLTNRVVRG